MFVQNFKISLVVTIGIGSNLPSQEFTFSHQLQLQVVCCIYSEKKMPKLGKKYAVSFLETECVSG